MSGAISAAARAAPPVSTGRYSTADPSRARNGALELVVYAHSLDFGKKAYGNLVELAHVQEHVAAELGCPVGRLVVHAKSAHVYEPEWTLMAELIEASAGTITA